MTFTAEIRKLAEELDQFGKDYDTFEYRDRVEDPKGNICEIEFQLRRGRVSEIREYLSEFIMESDDSETVCKAKSLLARLDGFTNSISRINPDPER